ncbi:fumarylacetoacetate hydrolase family protein [Brevibacillus formosus]|uniref:fumarylacetoacetate hydrolase family protein n=1 Tax=Brevibacillus formosus TaxID=54913 RepID=UPI0018CDE69A|nr:2-keto-4-pentenoate hydratase [Brevibacillus formosus]
MDIEKITRFADHLAAASREGVGVTPLTLLDPQFSEIEAYQVQLKTIERKVKEGARITGKKIGLTSRAMQTLLGVEQPDYGHLLDDMVVENNGELPFEHVLSPKVEAEIAFLLKRDLEGPHVTTYDVLMATEYVMPALEIVDSRIANWQIKLEDTVADNASSGFYVLGGHPVKPQDLDTVADNASSGFYVLGGHPVKPQDLDLPLIGMALYKNQELVNTGVGAAALGNPASCVAWLANKLHELGMTLKAGEIILSGALSAAVEAKPGDVFHTRLAGLGSVGVRFGEKKT